jgi:hypothetical protein
VRGQSRLPSQPTIRIHEPAIEALGSPLEKALETIVPSQVIVGRPDSMVRGRFPRRRVWFDPRCQAQTISKGR